jgi:hypothetical protein
MFFSTITDTKKMTNKTSVKLEIEPNKNKCKKEIVIKKIFNWNYVFKILLRFLLLITLLIYPIWITHIIFNNIIYSKTI